MLIRAWAIWDRNVWIIVSATPIILLEIATMAWNAGISTETIPFLRKTGPCFPVGSNFKALAYYASSVQTVASMVGG